MSLNGNREMDVVVHDGAMMRSLTSTILNNNLEHTINKVASPAFGPPTRRQRVAVSIFTKCLLTSPHMSADVNAPGKV